ncbi:expressed unknown protein [Seminavis robusta]|uniref:Uncharacterized protein n=1 Tax=Seminavis robusta TaxID=568900 RepID=A0A9N8F0U0_9STRA|nr:expressed unknown protein [Seminavis robusta]|eukprot:Sro2935_g340560.1 n/a (174) ;mRNA; f:4149-4743
MITLQAVTKDENERNVASLRTQGDAGKRSLDKIAKMRELTRRAVLMVRRHREAIVVVGGYRSYDGSCKPHEMQVKNERGWWNVSYDVYEGKTKRDRSVSRSMSSPSKRAKTPCPQAEGLPKQRNEAEPEASLAEIVNNPETKIQLQSQAEGVDDATSFELDDEDFDCCFHCSE